MYKIVDVKKMPRYKLFKWFNSFDNPCYGINKEIDVTEVVNYSKDTKTSFFINFLYLLMLSLNKVEEMRLRIVDGNVVLYDDIDPSYVVRTFDGNIESGRHKMTYDYNEFYQRALEEITNKKNIKCEDETFNGNDYGCYYITCLPWLDFTSMTHPIPSLDPSSKSVPRIGWGKFTLKDNRYKMMLNITVSHAFVDGKPLCDCFNNLEEILNDSSKYFTSSNK